MFSLSGRRSYCSKLFEKTIQRLFECRPRATCFICNKKGHIIISDNATKTLNLYVTYRTQYPVLIDLNNNQEELFDFVSSVNEKLKVVDPCLKSVNINALNTVCVSKRKNCTSDFELDYDYIMVKSAFNSYSHISQNKFMTVLTETNKKPVKNKSVVIGRLNSRQTKLFLTSGSEIKVIHDNFVKNVMKIDCLNFLQSL